MLQSSVEDQQKEAARLEAALKDFRATRSAEAAQAEQLAEEVERMQKELQESNSKLQAVCSGGVGASGSIREALKTSRSEEARLEAQDFSLSQEINYLKTELQELAEKEKNAGAVSGLQ